LTPDDIRQTVLRRRWLILLPFALGLATVPLVARWIPEVYRSESLMMVVPQRVPDSYVKSTVTATVEDRLPAISDQIMSRVRLESIIKDFDLYPAMRARVPLEDVVQRMRKDIGTPRIQRGAQSFTIGYSSEDPAIAQKVTARLASLFIDENSRDRENLAESTSVFLESELEDAKRRLLAQEKALEEYRRQHTGELPSQLESNQRAIGTAQLQLQSITDAARNARDRRFILERQLVTEQSPAVESATVIPGSPAGPDAQLPATPAEQLDLASRQLDVLRLRYTSDHPEVRRMERTVAQLKERVAEEAKRTVPSERGPTPSEQVRLKRVRDLQSDLAMIDKQLASSDAEEKRLNALIASYQQKIDAVPKRETELVELTRDYEILKKSYDTLATKREDSKVAANLERRQIGEQFRTVDPASLPTRPSNQMQRLALSFSGAAFGLLFGLGWTAFLVYRDSSFTREGDVTTLLELPVLALVPAIIPEPERQRGRRRRIALDMAGAAVLVASAAFVVVWGWRGL
jgi:polysaccharide chain length determinant protein (PEP-CTERM system associated)